MKLLVILTLFTTLIWAEDKPKDQPSLEDRFALMQAQRDFLLAANQTLQAQNKQADAGATLDQKVNEIGTKFNCVKWNADFTCVPKTKEEVKEEKKEKK
jgi:hypothetical protein